MVIEMRTETNIRERLYKNSVQVSSCRVWVKAVRSKSTEYGSIWFKGKTEYAHRVAYLVFKGEIPSGLEVMHSCDNPKCINPDHLKLGTHQENMNDMKSKGRAKGPSRSYKHG